MIDYKNDYEHAVTENVHLKDIIKRAVEYIEDFEYYIPEDNVEELLDILKAKNNQVVYKFYDMEDMTQDELNELALERNKLAESRKELLEELQTISKWNVEEQKDNQKLRKKLIAIEYILKHDLEIWNDFNDSELLEILNDEKK